MRRSAGYFALVVYLLASDFLLADGARRKVEFVRDIRPILADNCFRCHGPDVAERQAELRLDLEANAKTSRGGTVAIVSGRPEESELIARITAEDKDSRMPPEDSGKSLAPEEISLLRLWIEQGAPWAPPWAYVPPKRHALPPVVDTLWPRNWIDSFILARLEAEDLRPSPSADAMTLVRRLFFDLTGLPPSPEEVAAFASFPKAAAYEALVDRLLASQAFGERMAMYWLDLVRYADTVGYHGDQDHNISPYRDWVIDAFNDNMPFHQFTREQLAGDLLESSSVDQKIASGYNRLLQTSHEGGVQPKEYLAMYAADRVRNVSAVWMSATMGCAQCHDHKFDPFTIKDFYSMAAFFADIDEAKHFKKGTNRIPTARPPEIKVLNKRERQHLASLDSTLASLEERAAGLSSKDGEASRALHEEIARAKSERAAIESQARLTMVTVAIEPRTMRILPRGNWLDDTGAVVSPAIPEFLGHLKLGDRRATRLDLANWLTDDRDGVGGLTARVFMNRLWHLLFGAGISRTLDDFGVQGEAPSHPELLDNLAIAFIESAWNVKKMVKLLVLSRAYQQSSLESPELLARDPYNRLVARQGRFRLPAETIRDNALAISGLLCRDLGGPSVKPYQPAGYYRNLNFPRRTYQADTGRRQWRRGVYVHWQRQFLHPMLKAFDAPRREKCTAERPRSNTPLGALALLNDPTFVEAARVFAQRIVCQGGETTDSRLAFAFRWALSRTPERAERAFLEELLHSSLAEYRADGEAARALLEIGEAPVDVVGVDSAELAAWTSVARAVLNLNETITRN